MPARFTSHSNLQGLRLSSALGGGDAHRQCASSGSPRCSGRDEKHVLPQSAQDIVGNAADEYALKQGEATAANDDQISP